MPPTLRALLERVIDYAGLFPPAKLPLDESIHNYVAYRASPQAWMLGGFVCPVGRLDDLAALLSSQEPAPSPFDCCVIGSTIDRLKQAAETLREDLRRIDNFARTMRQSAEGDGPLRLSLEFRLPPDACSPVGQLDILLDEIDRAARKLEVPPGSVFLETPLDEPRLVAVARSVSSFLVGTNGVFGLKFRTGGLDASAYPSPEVLARGIVVCRDHRLPYKLTAGLHKPLRHADPALGTMTHGFLNVLIAAALAEADRGLKPSDIQAVLAEESAETFAFTPTELRWRDHVASLAQIAAARRQGLCSFGSCSFDEPVEGLRALGWMIETRLPEQLR